VSLTVKIPETGRVEAGRRLARDLLGKAGFQAVLVPKRVKSGAGEPPALITSEKRMDEVNPFVGVMPVNTAAEVARMTKVTPFPGKTALILRPCEMRALVELEKLKQAKLDHAVRIAVDCPGTYPVKEFKDRAGDDPEKDLEKRLSGDAEGLRDACRACVHPAAPWADLRLALFGTGGPVLVEALTPAGEEVVSALGYEETEAPERDAALDQERAKRDAFRETFQTDFLASVKGREAFLDYLSTCLRCQNCRTVCPLCYCKECFFDSPTFELEAEKYLGWAGPRGALRIPADTLLFHLTRLNHMVHSCVACGMCTQACPAGIDVGALFSSVGRNVQKVFAYEPGKSPDDELPLSTFREEELEVFGGK